MRVLTVEGVDELSAVEHTVMPDRIDAGVFVALDQIRDLFRRPDRAAHRSKGALQYLHRQIFAVGRNQLARETDLLAVSLELVPHVRATGAVLREDVIVRK